MANKAGCSTGEQKYLESQGVPPEEYQHAEGTSVPPPYMAPRAVGPVAPPPVAQSSAVVFPPKREYGLGDTYILAVALGFFGAHHFYLGRPGFGATYLVTFGLFGVGYLVDLFRVPFLVKEANAKITDPTLPEKKSMSDAYVLWFPLGFLGLHHFYLRRWVWGIAYLCTFGLFGIGWIVDGFRLYHLVKRYNEDQESRWPIKKSMCDAYVITLIPFSGLLGIQHYYLDRIGMGVCYTFSLGFFGVGWLVDLVRMPRLVKARNQEIEQGSTGKIRLDDAYILLFPLGWLGLHQFYLRRYGWGLLYLCTIGIFGIGWLSDFCRLPGLVKLYNQEVERRRLVQSGVIDKYGVANQGAVITVTTTTTGLPYPNGQTPGALPVGPMVGDASQIYPQQLPPYQPPYPQAVGQAPPPAFYQPYPAGYTGVQGPESYSTVTSSEGDQPPSYLQATDESAQNSLNENQSAGAPPSGKGAAPMPPGKKE